jgi:hypothetical protein
VRGWLLISSKRRLCAYGVPTGSDAWFSPSRAGSSLPTEEQSLQVTSSPLLHCRKHVCLLTTGGLISVGQQPAALI